MRPAARMPKLTRRSRTLIAIASDRDRAAAGRSATDRRVRRLALVRRAGLPLGVHHRAGDPAGRVRGDRAAGRRHRVRRPGAGVPHPAGLRPEQRQRSGGALSHRGDVAAAGDRYRYPGGDRPARRHCRADLLGAYPAVPARRRLRRQRSAVRQGPRLLRLRAAVLPAGAQLLLRRAVPGFRREPVGALHLRRHPAVRAHRCAEPLGAHPVGQPGRNAGAAQGRSPTGWTATSCCRTPAAASRSPAPGTPTSTRCCRPS